MSSLMLTLVVSLASCGQLAADSQDSTEQATPRASESAASAPGTPAEYLPPPEEREPVERAEKSYFEYRQEMKKWFVQEATAEKPSAQMEAIVGLCALYHELRTDPRYPLSDALQQYKIKIWSRLSKVKRELEYDLKQSEADTQPSDIDLLASDSPETPSEARGGGARRGDFGDDLVELIEKTIAPTKWDVNGGPFTIVYYAPLHALVVRASSEVHGRVGGLLGGLRQAGN